MLHCKPQDAKQWCASFNAQGSRRQMWMPKPISVKSFATVAECRQRLELKKCPFAGGGPLRGWRAKVAGVGRVLASDYEATGAAPARL